MTEPSGPVTDPEPNVESRGPLTVWNLPALCAVGFAGGVVGAVGAGVVGVLLGASTTREMLTDPSGGVHAWLGGVFGAALGLPLGVAVGLRWVGQMLDIRGRFRPALGWSFAAMLASLGPTALLYRLTIRVYTMGMAAGRFPRFLFFAAPFAFALVGGLVGYVGWREAKRLTPSPLLSGLRLLLLCAAGLAGALLAGVAVSSAATGIFRGPGMERLNVFAFRLQTASGSYVGMLGYPIGAAAALSLAGAWFRPRGRFWPALAGACAGLFAGFILVRLSLDSGVRGTFQGWTMRRYIESFPLWCLILSVAGGLAAYLVSRRTRRSYPWWLVAGVLLVTLTAAPALSIVKGRTRLPFTIRLWTARPSLPAFLRYPGVAATTRLLDYYTVKCIEYSFQTTDSPVAVVAFYRKALAGWQEVRAPGPQDGTAIFYCSRDGKQRVSGWAVRVGPGDSSMTSLRLLYQRGGRGVIVPAHP